MILYTHIYTLNSLSIKPYRWWIKKIPCRYASSTLRLGLRRPGQRRIGKLDSVWIRRSWMSTSSWANSMGNHPVDPQIFFDNGLTSTCVDMPRQIRLFSLFLWYYGLYCVPYLAFPGDCTWRKTHLVLQSRFTGPCRWNWESWRRSSKRGERTQNDSSWIWGLTKKWGWVKTMQHLCWAHPAISRLARELTSTTTTCFDVTIRFLRYSRSIDSFFEAMLFFSFPQRIQTVESCTIVHWKSGIVCYWI